MAIADDISVAANGDIRETEALQTIQFWSFIIFCKTLPTT